MVTNPTETFARTPFFIPSLFCAFSVPVLSLWGWGLFWPLPSLALFVDLFQHRGLFWAQPFLSLGSLRLLWGSGPLLSLFWASGLFWVFSTLLDFCAFSWPSNLLLSSGTLSSFFWASPPRLLGLFPAFSGPLGPGASSEPLLGFCTSSQLGGLFWAFLGPWASSGPFVGFWASSQPFLGPGASSKPLFFDVLGFQPFLAL